MWKGYKINIDKNSKIFDDKGLDYYKDKILKNITEEKVKKDLEKYINKDEVIEAENLKNDWFPEIDTKIFISYSHNDEDLALAFAGWIEENFKIKVFLDCYIWNSSDDLLRKIDNKYCYNRDTGMYNYQTRNLTTSHVHAMLTNAIMKMIDKNECFFLLSTEESLKVENSITKTYSPWIYTEIEIFNKIEKKSPRKEFFKEGIINKGESGVQIQHTPNMSQLVELNEDELKRWYHSCLYNSIYGNENTLDLLYKIK